MLEYLLNTCTNIFCQYCPRRKDLRRGAVMKSWCRASWPSPTTTLDRKRKRKGRHDVWWVEGFALCFSSVHGWMVMDVWVNVFTMPFLRTDSGPWRKMSRAWPAMSAITTSSGSTCPSHQESAWGAAEARQEKVIVEVVRKSTDAGWCWNICWTHLQMVFCQYCPRREDLRRGAVMRSQCRASWPSPTTTLDRKRTRKGRHDVWWVEGFALCFSSVHGWMGMDVWVNVFTMPFLRADSGPWRKMSRAWPAMSAITTSSGSTCPSRQESAWGAAEARQEKVIVEVVRKGTDAGRCWNICWTHLQMFSVSTVLGEKASDVGQSWGASAELHDRRPPPHWTGRGQRKEGMMFGELRVFLFVLVVCSGGWESLCELMSLRCHSCAQTLDRGEVRLRSTCQVSWPSPTTTLDRKGRSERRRHVWWVECFALCLF